MFTGLVEAVGEIVERRPTRGGFRLRIRTSLAGELAAGDSLAVSGVCLTVIAADHDEVSADVGPETARVTTLGAIESGGHVNLERPLRADGRMGGHFVLGHVDGMGRLEDRRSAAEFDWVTISFPPAFAPLIIPKGSIAIDGISLTVAELAADRFDVMVIPYTLEHTTLRFARPRDRVNLECDVVGKYVARAAELAVLQQPASSDEARQQR